MSILEEKLSVIKKRKIFFSSIPFSAGFVIVGSIGAGNPNNASDIDIMVISKDNHVWTVRFFTLFISLLFGIRNIYGKNPKDKFCFSCFYSESDMKSSLSIDKGIPVFGNKKILDKFFNINNIAIGNNFYIDSKKNIFGLFFEVVFKNKLAEILEKITRNIQEKKLKKYFRSHKKRGSILNLSSCHIESIIRREE